MLKEAEEYSLTSKIVNVNSISRWPKDANGVALDASGAIWLQGQKWPERAETRGQVVASAVAQYQMDN